MTGELPSTMLGFATIGPAQCLTFLGQHKVFLVEAEFLFATSKVFFGVH
jgi:hypothetical protein